MSPRRALAVRRAAVIRCRHLVVRLLVPLAVLAAGVWLLLERYSTYPAFWFDEGYKANAARTLAELGRFASRSANGLIPYDPGISGGPADIGAMALSFTLFGVNIMAARAPAVCFGLAALIALYGLVGRLHGPRTAALTCLWVLAAPPLDGVSLVLFARQALAEVPALSLWLCGLYVHQRAASRHSPHGGPVTAALLAGVLWGLAVLSRQQWALTLGPALLVWIGLSVDWQSPDWPRRAGRAVLPVLVMIGTVVAWKAVEYVDSPATLRAENLAMAFEATRTNLLTGLWGRRLTGTPWLMVAMMAGAAAGTAVWLYVRRRSMSADRRRFHLFLATGACAHAVWFALFSVGWPRYAFPGVFFALVSMAIISADVCGLVGFRRPAPRFAVWLAACAVLGAAAMAQAPGPATLRPDAAAEMAAAVTSLVPRDAIIESWESEIGALIGPERVHAPHQRYLFEAIRMRSHEGRPIALRYDVLQRDPAFLIRGPFAALARVYDEARLAECFRAVMTVEPYTLFERSGCRPVSGGASADR